MSTPETQDFADTAASRWRSKWQRGLQRQLLARFALVFFLVGLVSGLVALIGYQWAEDSSQRRTADETLGHVTQRHAALRDNWQRNADEVKAQVDFMRIFAGDNQADNWLRLRAYFAALEGKLNRFPSGVVLNKEGRALFLYGPRGAELARWLDAQDGKSRWYLSRDRHEIDGLLKVPMWLGQQGTGDLVMLQPLDNAVLRELSPPGARLLLVYENKVLASSGGASDYGLNVVANYTGRLTLEGRAVEQRSLPAFSGAPDGPRIVLQQPVREVLSPMAVTAVTLLLLMLFTLVLWLAIGRWAQQLTTRVADLRRATVLFAEEQVMSETARRALERAAVTPDEVGEAAAASAELMQNVMRHHQEKFGYLQTLDMLEEGVIELAPGGEYRHASPGWLRLAGRSEGNFYDVIHDEDRDSLRMLLDELFTGAKHSISGRARLRRGDYKDAWIEYRFVRGDAYEGKVLDVRGVLRDITQSYQLEKHVTHMALHDALTGLPNRVLLEDRSQMAVKGADRGGGLVALAFFDLDHFKHINDQFGHKTGDELLVTLSASLRRCLRAGDTLARWGGDEFVVLLTNLHSQRDAEEVITKLMEACRAPVRIAENEFNATFSMGVALYPTDADSVETLLSHADRAMFAAKQRGRNGYCFYSEIAQRDEERKAVYIQNRLATAIREQQIQAWFQPIIDARTRRVVSCEALARWHDDTYGWVSPATFVPMAENLGLIRELGQQIWRQAIENLHHWREHGMDMSISINVSRRQLFTPTFTADLLRDLDRLAIPVSVVDLEITESVAMEDAEHTERRLAELAEAGFGIAIDDFGTGYSSLSQLHDMPATKIKIDTSFVRRAQSLEGSQLVQAIVKIAGAFDLKTVAEGVETQETANALTDQGVTLLQGYHFGRPMPASDFERYLSEQLAKAV